MGYDCVNGEVVIVPDQAEVVRKIFDLYLQGLSLGQIKSYLESEGIKTVTGKDDWNAKTIRDMLKNEKYKGATMLQKTFTEDFMTGKKSENNGQRNKYYVKDSHSAIVSAEVFDKVQEEGDRIFTAIKDNMERGYDSPEVQSQINALQIWLNHFYSCDREMLRGVGHFYNDHPDFVKMWKTRYHEDMPGFLLKAIEHYCDSAK
jgi:hypothetical protein